MVEMKKVFKKVFKKVSKNIIFLINHQQNKKMNFLITLVKNIL